MSSESAKESISNSHSHSHPQSDSADASLKRHSPSPSPSHDKFDDSNDSESAPLSFDFDSPDEPIFVPLKVRRLAQESRLKQKLAASADPKEFSDSNAAAGQLSSPVASAPLADTASSSASQPQSLLDISLALTKASGGAENLAAQRLKLEESSILSHLSSDRLPLASARESAHGIKFTSPLNTDWRPWELFRDLNEEARQRIRKSYGIDCEIRTGDLLPPPPIPSFEAMRLLAPILKVLDSKGIKMPTPIQIQSLPCLLAGRDLIGIATTGQGKTLAFALPLIITALRMEKSSPLKRGEGPIGLIIAPSRELAQQTLDVLNEFVGEIANSGLASLGFLLAIGGLPMNEQTNALRNRPIHGIVATPGRVLDLLKKNVFRLDRCKFLALDEADRLIDMGFEETVREIFDFFKFQRQTALFSATMPPKIQEFALSALIQPVVVNVAGRAGAASLNITQRVEYVKLQDRLPYLLEILQDTAPPVLIFASNQSDVDCIQEYLLLRGVSTAAIHGGKAQSDRLEAVKSFKNGDKDVLVATDVASKGLDFPAIQHVINYDMPGEIENYIHRIGRTGRSGNRGLATTIINRSVPETVQLDLKHVLREAKQNLPAFLLSVSDPSEALGLAPDSKLNGCGYCGGQGHNALNCPKLRNNNRQQIDQDTFGGRD